MLRHAMLPTPIPLPDGVEDRLREYAALLATWTRRINLVSANDRPHIWGRHVQDSLRLLPLIPPGIDRAIDLGSGAGLPGLVVAIATGLHVHLVESDRRKAAFLAEASRRTCARTTVHACRIEALDLPPAPLVMARALAPLPELLRLALPCLAPGGTLLFPKGEKAGQEIDAARTGFEFDVVQAGPPGSPVLAITGARARILSDA